ncbi:LysM peptidoglycan-binding domain-containing protein [Spirosoma oryzicola]|uniref:LysM peptidoglycan-binding domain-containing protein n=1 Tax=Spirosoma oryzicola TaxID=2898794 RepID=UPI001E2879E6|nr:lytic transglycosylase domain-containing protein [Spirosoma oryzicola]UHG89948.1 LysM peptidoglycan-binding domain-containing protein [Spirosoma oryzicola]
MRTLTYSFTLLFTLISLIATAQTSTSIPVVPEQVTFADISVRFDPDARRIIQQDVNALLSNRQYWTAKLDRVALYFPMIEAILIDEDVPTDFKYLAVQESSLIPDAVSTSMAVGYWQFKRETATDHGLRVDDEIDERKSITASTHGAAKYLKRSNTQFNNWVASLYSYYLGTGGISKLIPPDWSYAREVALDGRTDRYILRFFAHKLAIENALKFHQAGNQFALIEYGNGGGKTLKSIAEELGVDEFELRKYNRWVQGESVPTDKAYVMAIPVANNQINDIRQKIVNVGDKKRPDFVQNDVGFPVLRRVTTGRTSKSDPILYEINGLPGIQAQAGDNSASLARKAKISLSSFLRYNDMNEQDPIIVNDVYYLAKKMKKALVPFHTVRQDETSRSISQRYGIRLKKLMRYNRLDRLQKLTVGRVMWLRERRPANKPVEIINTPTPPVYDQTPTPPTRTEATVADRAPAERTNPNRSVDGLGNVPRNASERKMYQPKLVGGGVTPNDGTSEPATAPRPEPTRTVTSPSFESPAPSSQPASTQPNRSTNNEGSQRVVIVRTPDSSEPPRTVPVATTPEREQPAAPVAERATDSPVAAPKATKSSDTYASNRPVRTAPAPEPERGSYEGPREQQADGSLTIPSTPPARSGSPAVVKNETRSTPPAEKPLPEPVKPSASVMNRPATPAATSTNRTASTHTVEPGQTYYSISKLYGLTVDQLLTLNDLTANDGLRVGQQLVVKKAAGSPVASAPTKSAATASQGTATYHTVAKGETMFRISKQYGVSIEQIQEWNNLTDNTVKEGQRIKIMK